LERQESDAIGLFYFRSKFGMSDDHNQSRYDESHDAFVFNLYNVVAVAIFCVMAFQLLFPSNRVIPLDRRTISVACATVCYVTRRFLFKADRQTLDIRDAIDFDVLLLLAAIMVHILTHTHTRTQHTHTHAHNTHTHTHTEHTCTHRLLIMWWST